MQTSQKNCKDIIHHHLSRRRHPQPPSSAAADVQRHRGLPPRPPSEQELKLAAAAIRLNARLRSSDMPAFMQEHALRYTRSLVGNPAAAASSALSPTAIARSLKKEFDGKYGPAWHCVVGKSFGSFVTHSGGGFLYFSMDSLSFLLFKTEVQVVKD